MKTFNHIVAAVDGSANATRAVAVAASLAKLAGAQLTLLHVVKSHADSRLPRHLKAFDAIEHASKTQEDVLRDAANEMLEEAIGTIGDPGIAVRSAVAYGDPARAIVQQAEGVDAEVIVMGSRGLSDLQGLLLGSVSHRVNQLAKCSVMLVP